MNHVCNNFASLSPNSDNLKISHRHDLCFKFYLCFHEGVLRALPAGRSPGSQCKSGRLPHRTLTAQADFRTAETLPMC